MLYTRSSTHARGWEEMGLEKEDWIRAVVVVRLCMDRRGHMVRRYEVACGSERSVLTHIISLSDFPCHTHKLDGCSLSMPFLRIS